MTSIEKLLINNESYIRAFFDGIPLPVYVFQKKEKDFTCIDHNIEALYENRTGFKLKLGSKASKSFKSYPEILEHLNTCINKKACFSHDVELDFRYSGKKYLHLKYGYISPDLVLVHVEDITEKSLITLKLRESEAKLKLLNSKLEERVKERDYIFQQIIETIPDIFFIISDEAIIIDFIGDEKELYLPSEDFMGKNILEILPHEVSLPLYEKIKETIKTKKATSYEYSLPMNNEIRHYEIRNLFFSENKIACFIRDISERKRSELKLIEERQKYEKLISNIPDAIYYTIHKNNLSRTFMSKRWEEWTGYSCEDLMENPMIWTKSIHPSDLKKVIHSYYVASKNKEEYTIEYRIVHKDSKKIMYIRDHGRVIKDVKGTIIRYDGILRDITKEKLIQKQLQINEKRYHLILENLNDLIYIINQNLETEYINESVFKKLLGFSRHNFIDFKPLDNIHPDDHNKALNAIKNCIKNREEKVNLRIKDNKDKFHLHELSGKFFKDYDGLQKALIISRDISDQVEIKEKLKASEEKYRIIAENAIDVIGIINDKYVIEYVNRIPLKKIAGYDLKDVLGKQGLDFVHPDDRETALRSLLKGKEKGEERSLIRFKHKDGHYLWIQSGGRVYKDKDGNLKGIIILRDVSARKEVEDNLKKSEEKYRFISENSSDLIRVLDQKFKIRYVNEQTHLNLLGYSAEELLGKSGILFVHPEEKEELSNFIKRLITKGEARREGRILNKVGNWKWMDIWAKLIPINENNWNGIVIMRDISERKEFENQLRASEERYRLISENANDMIGVLTKDLRLEYTNSKPLKKILGYNIKEIVGNKLNHFIHPDDLQKALEALKEGTIQGNYNLELRFKHKDGSYVWLAIGGQAFKDLDGKYKGIIISRDIDEKKKTEEALRKSEKLYREAFDRANFYKDLFAHDINNILQIVNSSAEMMQIIDKKLENPKLHELTKIIMKQVSRGTKLVKDVHTLSELENKDIKLNKVEICSQLKESISNISKMYYERKILIKLDSHCDEILIFADEFLKQVFENLLINGIKYNDKESIEIHIKISEYQEKDKNFIKLEFIDNGIGIRNDHKKEIFKQGNREFKGSKGMGIGLSLVKKILSTYNAKIWVENRIEEDYSQGSNFIILIPTNKPLEK